LAGVVRVEGSCEGSERKTTPAGRGGKREETERERPGERRSLG